MVPLSTSANAWHHAVPVVARNSSSDHRGSDRSVLSTAFERKTFDSSSPGSTNQPSFLKRSLPVLAEEGSLQQQQQPLAATSHMTRGAAIMAVHTTEVGISAGHKPPKRAGSSVAEAHTSAGSGRRPAYARNLSRVSLMTISKAPAAAAAGPSMLSELGKGQGFRRCRGTGLSAQGEGCLSDLPEAQFIPKLFCNFFHPCSMDCDKFLAFLHPVYRF